ncbi:hypothetical protein V8E55_005426 [Tylopilus felleus]
MNQPSSACGTLLNDISDSSGNVKEFPGASQAFPHGSTFMDQFFFDKYGELCKENLYYLFTSQQDWQPASWLLHSHLSMAAINSFLSLQLIKQLLISFRTVRDLHCCTELLPSGPVCILSHPFFERHIDFVSRKVWSTATRLLCVYDEWLTGDHAWELQASRLNNLNVKLPEGATLLGVVLSSDKTNISVMSGNHMVHPLLLSLANIASDIRSKGPLHAHLLLALLPVPSFIHKKSHIHSLLSNQLFHHCLDLVLAPLKIAAAISIIMNDPLGNLWYCYTPLVGYSADTPEQCLLSCTSPRSSPIQVNPNDFNTFLKVAKSYRLNSVHKPFWRDWPISSSTSIALGSLVGVEGLAEKGL